MTVSEFKQEIKSRTNRRTSLTAHDNSLPLEAVIHITEAIVEDNHPAVILFRDGINMMRLSQIVSISKEDSSYTIICGFSPHNRRVVTVLFSELP